MSAPVGLEGRWYTDPSILAREQDAIFARAWVLVGHRTQVAEPGQVLTAPIGNQSVVVANHDGQIGAFYNVCMHRGHELVLADQARLRSIVCPYHAWTYDLGGRLRGSRRADVGDICVPRVQVAELAGFLFVNLDPDAPPVDEAFPGVEDRLLELAPDARERRLTARLSHTFAANWKLAVENYNECYHCPNVHRAFTAGVVDPDSYRITPNANVIRHDAVVAAQAGYHREDLSADADAYGSFYTWPLSSIQCYPGRVLNTFRWIVGDVATTTLIREWWFHTDEPTPAQQTVIDLDWTTTVAEDFDLMESVQRGMRSRGYTPGPLVVDPCGVADTRAENAVPHLQDLVRAAIGDA